MTMNGKVAPALGALCSLLALLTLSGCARSTIETRKHERWMAYASLPEEQRSLVDQGKIRVGMNQDSVYIAWGKPTEVTEAETTGGHTETWRYSGSWSQENRYWTYREVQHEGRRFLERYLDTDLNMHSYVRAEIVFAKGKVLSWRTLPKPMD